MALALEISWSSFSPTDVAAPNGPERSIISSVEANGEGASSRERHSMKIANTVLRAFITHISQKMLTKQKASSGGERKPTHDRIEDVGSSRRVRVVEGRAGTTAVVIDIPTMTHSGVREHDFIAVLM
ncbi:hypothetical protein AND_006555 [Anopheles darlingi]|uniref:Uncharacterized protein n=1 Tax=Anopheles darlingi TaxID=43151 RepID=W5JG41_ANODA|nr:hypothetical protein AND_006555 [Anopheles darlingi]